MGRSQSIAALPGYIYVPIALAVSLVAMPLAAVAQVGGSAARDVSIIYSEGCYKITNFSARRIQVKQGIYITQLERGESKRGPCVTMFVGDTTATYLDPDPAPPVRPAPAPPPPRVVESSYHPIPTPEPRAQSQTTSTQNISNIRIINLCARDVRVTIKWHLPRETGWTISSWIIDAGKVAYLSYAGNRASTSSKYYYWYAKAPGFVWKEIDEETDISRMIVKENGVDTIVHGRQGIAPPGTRDAEITLKCESNATPDVAS